MKCEVCEKLVTDDDFLTEAGAPIYYHHEDSSEGPIFNWTPYVYGKKWVKIFCNNQHSNDWYDEQHSVEEAIENKEEIREV